MKKSTILLLIFFTFLLSSCSNDLDLSNSWIKYGTRANHLDSSETFIKSDTIYIPLDEKSLFHIYTQSNDGSKPKIYKQIDDQIIKDITDLPLKAPMIANYFDPGGGYKQINEIHIYFPSHLYSKGQTIRFITTIGSHTGEIKNEIYLMLK